MAKLKDSHANWVADDERRRKEFAKAFGWFEQRGFAIMDTPSSPSWEQIFVQIGKLLVLEEMRR